MSSTKLLFIFLATALCTLHTSSAQEIFEIEDDYAEIWIDLTLDKNLSDKWTVGGDVGFRTTFNESIWKLFYLRPFVNYRFTNFFNLTGGIASFNTFSREFDNAYEFRIFQDANFEGPKWGPLNFLHRIRLEQRFFTYSGDRFENEFSFRGRYLIGFRTDPFSFGGQKSWMGYVSLEPFIPLGGEAPEIFANNFRWNGALAYQVSENLRIELHYVFQTSEIFSSNELRTREHILRFRVFQRL